MSALERRLWTENIDVLRAQELLREKGGELDPDELFRTIWLATGDKDKADRARSRRCLDANRRK